MSEALDSDVNEDSGTVRKPLSGTLIFNESLNSNSIDDLRPSHPGCDTLHVRVVARKHPQIEDCCNSTSLNVGNNIVGGTPWHQDLGSPDACVVARKHSQSEGGCNSTSLNVGNDIVGETPRHQELGYPDARAVDNLPGDEFELSNSVTDVGNDIGFCIEQVKVEEYNQLVGPDVPTSLRCSASSQRQRDAR